MHDLVTLAASDASDDDVLAAASRTAGEAIGHDLCTAMRFHPATIEVERIHSSLPDAYPPGGRKPKKDTSWGRHVLTDGQVYVGGEDAIRAAFTDHDLIFGLGLRFVANIPVRSRGQVVGTFNLLSGSIDYSTRDLSTLHLIAGLLAARVLVPDTRRA